jgi:hypothetical protein
MYRQRLALEFGLGDKPPGDANVLHCEVYRSKLRVLDSTLGGK